MARKNSGGGLGLVILILLALAVKYWTALVTVGGVVLVGWLFVKLVQSWSSSSAKVSSQALATSTVKTVIPSPPEQIASPPPKSDIQHPSVRTEVSTGYQTSHSHPSTEKQSVHPDSVWVPCGRTIQHAGYTISGGLLYFGSNLPSVQRWNVEPSLIDPKLSIDSGHPDRQGQSMGYWPYYSQIHASARAAYLDWLAGGRNDPQAYIGYVFLYFYGLERRALADAIDSASARRDIPAIVTEVKRLLAIYKNNGSFNGYASSFLSALEVSHSNGPLYRTTPQITSRSWEVPLTLKVVLGQVAADGVPLPVEWALAWAENDPGMPCRTPVQRCRQEFRDLFRVRYSERFGAGMTIKPNKTRLRPTYRPASASFGGTVDVPISDLPDITAITGPSSKISDIVNACTEELEGYSRYLGRNPDGRDSIEAASYLPEPLLGKHAGKELKALRNWLANHVHPDLIAVIPLAALMQHVPSVSLATLGKKEATVLANLLAKMKVGMEPDPRFGTFIAKDGQDVVLFRMSDGAPSCPSTEYAAATVVLHLASAVAGADGTVDSVEQRHLQEHLETWLHLSADEKTRLRAHTQWLLTSFPGMNGVKKRIELLSKEQRESLGRFLVGVAQADGYIDPTEMKILTKIYEMLGLDTQSLYSQAHAAAVEPITVQTADFVKPYRHVIPPPPKPAVGVVLDMGTVEAKLAETVAVSAILNNIFTESEPAVPEAVAPALSAVPEASTAASIAGLDLESFAFMQLLASKLMWARQELESLASNHSLMLDGTLDSINDASFDHFGGPFFEGDDPIEINAEYAKEIAA